ncbi:centromere protein R [Pempheris klunzingeri]|uniref:centromere protein R n=1 Tax=Pempheris klunzingeri TaxID=3127111 RepID=UPI003981117F
MDNTRHHRASKLPVPVRHQALLTEAASSPAEKTKTTRHEQEPQTELEKLDSLRSKLEQSVDAFIKARKELEEIFSAEGSSEQERVFTGSSSDLRTELRRHRELTSRLKSSLKESKHPKNHSQGREPRERSS